MSTQAVSPVSTAGPSARAFVAETRHMRKAEKSFNIFFLRYFFLKRVCAALAGPYPHPVVDRCYEYLAVAYLAGPGSLGYGGHHPQGHFLRGCYPLPFHSLTNKPIT